MIDAPVKSVVTKRALTVIAKIKSTGREPRAYSGRGMCGAYCVGVNLRRGESYSDLPSGSAVDSMGLGTIRYWRTARCDSTLPQE